MRPKRKERKRPCFFLDIYCFIILHCFEREKLFAAGSGRLKPAGPNWGREMEGADRRNAIGEHAEPEVSMFRHYFSRPFSRRFSAEMYYVTEGRITEVEVKRDHKSTI